MFSSRKSDAVNTDSKDLIEHHEFRVYLTGFIILLCFFYKVKPLYQNPNTINRPKDQSDIDEN